MALVENGKYTAYPQGWCYCGCRTRLKSPQAFFAVGHDKKATARIIEEQYGNIANFILAHKGGPDAA